MSKKIIDYIQSEFDSRKNKNPLYSLRAFARDAQTDVSTISRILSSKRDVSFLKANSILDGLRTPEYLKNTLLLSLINEKNYKEDDEIIYKESSEYPSDDIAQTWFFPVITHGLRLNKSIDEIAAYLGVEKEEIEKALEVLERIGKVKKEGHHFRPTNIRTHIKSDKSQKALNDHHIEVLDHTKDIFRSDNKGYYFTNIVNIPVDKYDEAFRRINEFQDSLISWIEQFEEDSDDIARLYITLHSLEAPNQK